MQHSNKIRAGYNLPGRTVSSSHSQKVHNFGTGKEMDKPRCIFNDILNKRLWREFNIAEKHFLSI